MANMKKDLLEVIKLIKHIAPMAQLSSDSRAITSGDIFLLSRLAQMRAMDASTSGMP